MDFKKCFLSIVLVFFSAMVVSYAEGSEAKVVKKQASILVIDFPNKTMNELRQILLEKSKRMALSEIYGEIVRSETEVENFVLSHDLISSKALGIIRIKGTPRYYNGSSLGELCVSIEAFVTQEDLIKFEAKRVVIESFCLSDSNAPLAKLRSMAREAAYIEIIKRHNPSLEGIGIDDAKSVIHDFYLSNENVDVNSGAYCMDISASIIPIEIEVLAGSNKSPKDKAIANRTIVKDKQTKGAQIIRDSLKIKREFIGHDKLIYNDKQIFTRNHIREATASPDGKRIIVLARDKSNVLLCVVNWDGSEIVYHRSDWTPSCSQLSNIVWTSNDSFRLRIGCKRLGDYNKLERGTYNVKIDKFNSIVSLKLFNGN